MNGEAAIPPKKGDPKQTKAKQPGIVSASELKNVEPQVPSINLPKGGGNIKSIDEKFTVNAVNGTATLRIPLPFSASRNFAPEHSLNYDSGSGNGTFGIGWALNLPSIKRKTDKALPRYADDTDSDPFIFTGAEELVPEFENDAAGVFLKDGNDNYIVLEYDRTVSGTEYRVRRYRPRIEGLFSRIERYTSKINGVIHWRVLSGLNITTIFGRRETARIYDPADERRIAEWLIDFTYDDKGNCIAYDYQKEDKAGMPQTLHNRNRFNGNAPFTNSYIKKIRYGNIKPYTDHHAPIPNDFCFETVFDYGEHDTNIPFDITGTWTFRPDAFSHYNNGFETRVCRLCRRVMLYHSFSQLPGGKALVRSLDLEYGNNDESGFTFLTSAINTGYTKHDDGSYSQFSTPPFSLTYEKHKWDFTIQSLKNVDAENAPIGLQPPYQLFDLFSEGLPGILSEQANGWFYKANLTGGHFAPATLIRSKPSFSGLANQWELVDLEGNGIKQFASWNSEPKGFFELSDEEAWQEFIPFEQMPTIDLDKTDAKLLDLNGDGQPDLLIAGDDVFTWYPSKGKKGFGEPFTVWKGHDPEKGPALVFSNDHQSIFLADMNGDGLSDLVRVTNSEVCYWPNCGYGIFGARISMDNSPHFDVENVFKASRIKLADIDGSGTTDIVYFGSKGISIWLNQQGNSFLKEPKTSTHIPQIDDDLHIEICDLLANGLSCITFSSVFPADNSQGLRYIDLMAGTKPHLLKSYSNNQGNEVHLSYTPSTVFCATHKLGKEPWSTKLHFPVHCVSKVKVFDRILKTTQAREYSYHHGYYDHEDREFRGFGRVDETDAETITNYVIQNGNSVEEELHQPPVLTKSWFHTGAFYKNKKILDQFAHEYFQNTLFTEKLLPDAELPPGLSTDEHKEVFRACKGMLLRKEMYALDGTTKEKYPYTAEQNNCMIKLLQPKGSNKYAVVINQKNETIQYNYEREPGDPRITHHFIFDIDPYGNILDQASVVYGRVIPGEPEQQQVNVVFSQSRFTKNFIDDFNLRNPLLHFTKSYEVTGLDDPGGYYDWNKLNEDCTAASTLEFDQQPGPGLQKRLISYSQIRYRADDGVSILAFGTIAGKGLFHQSYKAVFNQPLLISTFQPKITSADLQSLLTDTSQGGYILSNGYYWIPSGTQQYDPAHFYLPVAYTDPYGNLTKVEYDPDYFLFIKKITDPVNNETILERLNYRVLAPLMLRDHNDNLTAFRYDELGRPVKTFVIGKKGVDKGDEFDESKVEMKNAKDFPSVEMEYSDHEWLTQVSLAGFDINSYKPKPCYTKSLRRETHYHAHEQHQSKISAQFSYVDGSGRVVLVKVQAEPGEALHVNPDGTITTIANTAPALRWVGNGRIILNNKANPVKQYEPYFSTSSAYDDEKEMVQLGVTKVLHYDPVGRIIRTVFPNKTFSQVEIGPWKHIIFDANDTAKNSSWYADLGSPDPSSAEPLEPQVRAAWLAAKHDNTPEIVHLDAMGRKFLTISNTGAELIETKAQFDILGNEVFLIDGPGRICASYIYDMLGQPLKKINLDSGARWLINNVTGKPIRNWNDRDHTFRFVYDSLQRMTGAFVRNGISSERMYIKIEHGENIAGDKLRNLRGRIFKTFDQSGMSMNDGFDFKGNPSGGTKQFASDYKNFLDWGNPVQLDEDVFTSSTQYDAVNRPLHIILPHIVGEQASEVFPGYNEAGLLNTVNISIRGAASLPFVTNIDYDAKGQRESIVYQNNTSTKYSYYKETFALKRLLTTRNAGTEAVQDLNYTYDPVGNLTEVKDNAQAVVFFNGEEAAAHNKYEYDALYRLVKAKGRKHAGQTDINIKPNLSGNATYGRMPFINSNSINPNDANAFCNYRELYSYDKAGNMKTQQHVSACNPWTRNYEYDNGNNANNRLTSSTVGSDTNFYTFDMHGNMQGLETLISETWDFLDQFIQADLGGGGKAYYIYDHEGVRVRKIIERPGGIIKERIYFNTIEVYREKSAGQVTLQRETLHVKDDERRIAMVDTPVVKPPSSNEVQTIRYNYEDHLGSSALELDQLGKTVSYEEYFPFGTTAYATIDATREVPAKRYRYTGKERDEESGLNYHGARYYCLWLCRWTAADPIDANYNPYLYGFNNPVMIFDPDGKDDECKPPFKCEKKPQKEFTAADARIFMEKEIIRMGGGGKCTNEDLGTLYRRYLDVKAEYERKMEGDGPKLIADTGPRRRHHYITIIGDDITGLDITVRRKVEFWGTDEEAEEFQRQKNAEYAYRVSGAALGGIAQAGAARRANANMPLGLPDTRQTQSGAPLSNPESHTAPAKASPPPAAPPPPPAAPPPPSPPSAPPSGGGGGKSGGSGIGPAYSTFEAAEAAAAQTPTSPGKKPHVLGVLVYDKSGKKVGEWYEISESGSGMGGHTEQKALSRMKLEEGMSVEFVGHYSPCNLNSGCSSAMSTAAKNNKVDIRYRHVRENGTTIYEFKAGEGQVKMKDIPRKSNGAPVH